MEEEWCEVGWRNNQGPIIYKYRERERDPHTYVANLYCKHVTTHPVNA